MRVSNEQLQKDISERKQSEVALKKHRSQLQEQLSFASALNRMAETIIRKDDTHNILQTMTEIIGSTMNLDRAFIYDIDFVKHQVIGLCEWLNPNSPNAVSTLGTFSLDYFKNASSYIMKHRKWIESHIDNYSPYAFDGSGDLLHKGMQVKSGLWYPFCFHDQGYYCIIFSQVDYRRIWRKEELDFIASVAQLVEIALQKIDLLTQQKHAEEELRLSEERFNMAFQHSPVSMSISSLRSGVYIDANECCVKMHGYSRDEFIGRTALDLNLWVDMDERAWFLQTIQENGFVHNYEIKCFKKSGEIFEAFLSGAVIDLNGEQCLLVIKADITELRQYRRELFRLERLNLIGQMAAGIAHEIRNPMTTVKGFLQLLSRKKEYEHNANYFSLMLSELDRANSILTEFLSLVKTNPVDLKKKNLNRILESLKPLLQADAMVADISVELELSRISDLLLDDKEIRQLILNLVRNGFEAMSPGGKLIVRTYMENNQVVLLVQDQGRGINDSDVIKVGTPFFTTKDNGTGLGLATCYSIVARHNAIISFNSSPTGTTFYIKFETLRGESDLFQELSPVLNS